MSMIEYLDINEFEEENRKFEAFLDMHDDDGNLKNDVAKKK